MRCARMFIQTLATFGPFSAVSPPSVQIEYSFTNSAAIKCSDPGDARNVIPKYWNSLSSEPRARSELVLQEANLAGL